MKLDAYTSVQFESKKQLTNYKNKRIISNSTNVSFKGLNVSRLGKKLIKNSSGDLGQKIGRFTDESVDLLKQFFIKITKKDKMPFNSKPLIAPEDLEDLEVLAKAGDITAKATLEVAKKLLNKGLIDRSSDVFTSGGEIKAEAAERFSKSIILRAQAHATDNFHISDRMAPKSAKGLLDDILPHVEDNKYTSSLLKDQSKYLDDVANNKINHLSADFNHAPGDRTSIQYQTEKHYENEIDRLKDQQIHGKTPQNMSLREANESLSLAEKDYEHCLMYEHPEHALKDPYYLKEHPVFAKEFINTHPEYANDIVKQNPEIFSKTIKETVSDKIKNIEDNVKENSGRLKGTIAEKLGLHPRGATSFQGSERSNMDDFLNQNTEKIDFSTPEMEYFTGIPPETSGLLEHSTSVLDNIADVAEKLQNPVVETVLAEAPIARFFKPIKDFADGKTEKGVIGTITRGAEVGLNFVAGPIKLGWSVLGGIRGATLKLAGIKGECTGFYGGYKMASGKWAKARNGIEDSIIGEKKVKQSLESRLINANSAQAKREGQAVSRVEEWSNQISTKIRANTNSEITKVNKFIEYAEEIKETAQNQTSFFETQAQEVNKQLSNEAKMVKLRLEELMVEKSNLEATHNKKVFDYNEKIITAQKNSNTNLQKQLEKQLKEIENEYKVKAGSLVSDIVKTRKLINIYEKISNKTNAIGFKKIAGYKEQITDLLNNFATPIRKEKAGEKTNVPNAILFYGPKGTGKTTFAKAFAEHLDCDLVDVKNSLIPEEDLINLKNAAKRAKERFLKDGTRTIIQIDELDVFAAKDNPRINDLETFIANLSNNYHCTLFTTTNYPKDINEKLLNGNLFYKAALPPANKENISAIIKHYIGDFADKKVDYDELAQKILNFAGDRAYSNSRITNTLTNLPTLDENLDKLLTQSDIYKAIISKASDIDAQSLRQFRNQTEFSENVTAGNGQNSFAAKTPKDTIKVTTTKTQKIEEPNVNQIYDQYVQKLADEHKMSEKIGLIREVIPDLMPIKDDETAMQEVLEAITPLNINFITKQALPAILRNQAALSLEHLVGPTIKSISPDTVDSLDKLAANAEKYMIKNQTDTLNLLKSLTKDNKDFAFRELFPYLIENAEKYQISRGGYLAKYLEVITPKNKDFMLNKVIPSIMANSSKLGIDIVDTLKIAKYVTNNNDLSNINIIANNIEKYNLQDEFGLLDVDKFCLQLQKIDN